MNRVGKNEPTVGSRAKGVPSAARDIEAFVAAAQESAVGPRGRLVFALDATMSRQPTWDIAANLQAGMFDIAARAKGLDVQLVFFRGHMECRASRWVSDARALKVLMARIQCQSGNTQIGRILSHVAAETRLQSVNAVVYVGDALEESADEVLKEAGALGLLGVKAFMFHEGGDPVAGRVFNDIARLTGGAYLPFDTGSAQALGDLLGAIAAYASGGMSALRALERDNAAGARLLIAQLGQGGTER